MQTNERSCWLPVRTNLDRCLIDWRALAPRKYLDGCRATTIARYRRAVGAFLLAMAITQAALAGTVISRPSTPVENSPLRQSTPKLYSGAGSGLDITTSRRPWRSKHQTRRE
jgi:hypothetical protein